MPCSVYTEGDVTSQNLWSRHDRHVVGITWHDVWLKAKIYRVMEFIELPVHTKLNQLVYENANTTTNLPTKRV